MGTQLSSLIYEYQQVMLGKTKTGRVANEIWRDGNELYNHDLATAFLREYIVEKLLGWTPQEMYVKFTERVVRMLRLSSVLQKIIIPPEATRTDYFVYAHVLYPDIITVNFKSMTISTYNRVLSGFVKRYPRGFFSDDRGRERAIVCLRYVISQKSAFSDIENLYRQFVGDSGKKFIDSNKLTLAMEYQFKNPLDYLNATMSPKERDEALYNYYRLCEGGEEWPRIPFIIDDDLR